MFRRLLVEPLLPFLRAVGDPRRPWLWLVLALDAALVVLLAAGVLPVR